MRARECAPSSSDAGSRASSLHLVSNPNRRGGRQRRWVAKPADFLAAGSARPGAGGRGTIVRGLSFGSARSTCRTIVASSSGARRWVAWLMRPRCVPRRAALM